MKKILLAIFVVFITAQANANHLKGGWIQYEYMGTNAANGNLQYRITVRQYLNCNATGGQIDANIFLGIFKNQTNELVQTLNIPLSGTDMITMNTGLSNPCISPPQTVCYRIDKYVMTAELPSYAAGYTLSVQRCCRIAGIVNVNGSNTVGVTYSNTIPGIITGTNYEQNSSPVFNQKDTVAVCFNGNFNFDFGAFDANGDSLSYSFCDGSTGGGQGNPSPNPPAAPPYSTVPYSPGYSGSSPLGPLVSINPLTGLVYGVAPPTNGDYTVAVCVSEFRNGVLIGITKKEIHVTVANCVLDAAKLKPSYITCDGFTLTFQNESAASGITNYFWDFGVNSSNADTSTLPMPTFTYPDTGVYVLKLKVYNGNGCADSTTALVRVYPGFIPNFNITGSCFQSPFNFTDATTTVYGVVDSWRWDFGDASTFADTSLLKNPSYTYPTAGTRTAQLIVTNSKGCIDTISKIVNVRDIPALTLPFKDTLICSIDTLPLIATGNGVFSWTPNYNISNTNTSSPFVFPKDTTQYIVTLNEFGCVTKDTITVNVLDYIEVNAGLDSGICLTDTMHIRTVSHALSYLWTPSLGLNDNTIKNPIASPATTTKYYVSANLGKCQARDSVTIRVTPYPQAEAGNNVTICYGNRTQLNGVIVGSSFNWSPSNSLLNSNSLNPISGPIKTTQYFLTAYDTLGCPKPYRDSVLVTVIPPLVANAGSDTSIVVGQPLQLNATGGVNYAWSPTSELNNPNINNPIYTNSSLVDSIILTVRVSSPEGCFADDQVKIIIFKTGPEIFVPTGFTPNNDYKNDILKAVPVGIKQFKYFRIYNRWGQLVFSTSDYQSGWDGTLGGKMQPSGAYVYIAEAIDYEDKTLFRKGTTVLIR